MISSEGVREEVLPYPKSPAGKQKNTAKTRKKRLNRKCKHHQQRTDDGIERICRRPGACRRRSRGVRGGGGIGGVAELPL